MLTCGYCLTAQQLAVMGFIVRRTKGIIMDEYFVGFNCFAGNGIKA